jgi:hypothetical protein
MMSIKIQVIAKTIDKTSEKRSERFLNLVPENFPTGLPSTYHLCSSSLIPRTSAAEGLKRSVSPAASGVLHLIQWAEINGIKRFKGRIYKGANAMRLEDSVTTRCNETRMTRENDVKIGVR